MRVAITTYRSREQNHTRYTLTVHVDGRLTSKVTNVHADQIARLRGRIIDTYTACADFVTANAIPPTFDAAAPGADAA